MNKPFLIKGFLSLFLSIIPLVYTFSAYYTDVSVHDPSVTKVNGTYYVVGSHMASAKSNDLMRWTQLSSTVSDQSFFSDISSELSEALTWGQSETFWAGDWIQLSDGRYYMYYCVCKGDCPQSCIGYAVSDSPEGPYTNLGILLKSSGGSFTFTNPSTNQSVTYNSNIHPNAVDPNVFFDANGNFWMVYGSYSGGIYILKMDPSTGKPVAGQDYYGKKLLGGYHSRIEAPYIIYSPDTKYYYLFLSFGGLSADGGYNIRVCRSVNPDGPYEDAAGNTMTNCMGTSGQYLEAQDAKISAYGVKLMGNFIFNQESGEVNGTAQGYVSPGHNSAYYDANSGKYYLIFHSRFPNQGEAHSVRVHQMFMNEQGWPVVAPFRFAGETIGSLYDREDLTGTYKFINHGTAISADITASSTVTLNDDGSITGSVSGTWSSSDNKNVTMTIANVTYSGVFLSQTDFNTNRQTMTFTLTGKNTNNSLWGSKIAYGETRNEIEDGAVYFIQNAYSGLYLDIPNGVNEDGTNLQQWEYNGFATQQFIVKTSLGGYYNMASACSDYTQYVTVADGSAADGANIETRSVKNDESQLFNIQPNNDGTFRILTMSSDTTRSLEDYNFGVDNATNVDQWEYWGGELQHWIFTKVKHAVPDQTLVSDYSKNNVMDVCFDKEQGDLLINNSSTQLCDISIYNLNGQMLFHSVQELEKGWNRLSVSNILSSIHIVSIRTADGEILVKKF